MAAALTKVTDDYTALTEAQKVALFKATALEEPTVAEVETIGKFKVLMYKESQS